MSETEPPRIVAAVGGEGQRAAMLAAGEQFSYCIGTALGADWPVRLRLIGLDDAEIPPGVALIAAPLEDLTSPAPIAATEARWVARIARYRAAGHDRILLCNLFRRAGADAGAVGGIERVRRLNRLAIELSRRLGVEIVDVDRLLGLCGARTIASAEGGGEAATSQLVGHAIAEAMLQGELGGCLEPAVQARASAIHGDSRNVSKLIARFLRPGDRA